MVEMNYLIAALSRWSLLTPVADRCMHQTESHGIAC